MVPAAVSALKDHSMNDPNGIMTVQDMAEKEYLKLYKEDKYWNMELKEEFLGETRGFWEGNHSDKYRGRIFASVGAEPSKDWAMAYDRIDREMNAAVEKHGPMTLATDHVDEFYEAIDKKKSDIVSRA